MKRTVAFAVALATLVLGLRNFTSLADDKDLSLEKADAAFAKHNWKDAAEIYARHVKAHPRGKESWRASVRLMECYHRLYKWDDLVGAAEDLIRRNQGTYHEAAAERLAGNMYLRLPHWGHVAADKFVRGHWGQQYKYSYSLDRKKAIGHFERARRLYAALAASPKGLTAGERKALPEDRVASLFELAGALVRFGPYDATWGYWWYGWDELTDDKTVAETVHGRRGRGRWYGGPQVPPRGLPVDLQGRPVFMSEPAKYAPGLHSTQKIKYLLSEIGRIDATPGREHAARALYTRAMIARARYGPDRIERLRWWWWQGSYPYKPQLEKAALWKLADDEALTLLATRLAAVKLPPDEDVIGLLRRVVKEHPLAGIAPEARYALALYYQTRQQYKHAIDEYAALQERHPKHPRVSAAQSQYKSILRREVKIGTLRLQMAGTNARIPITYRNGHRIRFRVRTLDLDGYIADAKARLRTPGRHYYYYYYGLNNLSYALLHPRSQWELQHMDQKVNPLYEKYVGKEVASWTENVADDGQHRYATAEVRSGVSGRGAYLVEAFNGESSTRNILLLSDLAIVKKNLKGNTLFWLVDAASGRPVPGASLEVFEWRSVWRGGKYFPVVHETRGRTSERGTYLYRKRMSYHQGLITVARTRDGRTAFSGIGYWNTYYNPPGQYSGRRALVVTDRPVYRPGQTVNFKVFARVMHSGRYARHQGAGPTVWVNIRDSRGKSLFDQTRRADEVGCVSGSVQLGPAAALGAYAVSVKIDGYWANVGGNWFRVEEYKKPEYEVTVTSGDPLVRLGKKFKAKVAARYYFGAPVAEATVSYKVFRTSYTHRYTTPGWWDWLYGTGYGRAYYSCRWFGWWGRWGWRPWFWYPWWGPAPKAERELVQEGKTRIGSKGTVEFTVDTAAALANHPDTDHRYTIEAEVVDRSRRTIKGSGEVLVTRQAFYAHVEAGRGWYRPGDTVGVVVKTMKPGGAPLAVKGTVEVSRVDFGDARVKAIEAPQRSWSAATDEDGNLSFKLEAGRSGQFTIKFRAKDATGAEVLGTAMFWVVGDDFNGKVYRFNSLEVITDRRTYKAGDTAYLMVNADRAGSVVLFADKVHNGAILSYRFIDLPGNSAIVPIEVTRAHEPNFFVEATLVSGGKIHQDVREVVVPPSRGMVKVAVKTDKATYKPGETGTIEVTTTTPDGKPVSTHLALAAYDRSVLYIQPEITPDIRQFFWGTKRTHYIQRATNLDLTADSWGPLYPPQNQVWVGGTPQGWLGFGDQLHGSLEGLLSTSTAAPGAIYYARGGGGGPRDKSARSSLRADKAGAPAEREKRRAGEKKKADDAPMKEPHAPPRQPAYKKAEVRKKFADTALWVADLVTDETGRGKATVKWPENLTTWRIKAHGMTAEVRVGAGSTRAITTKNLIVRLQAPRFFVERDEVVLSANLHNYLKTAKRARVSLLVPSGLMKILGKTPPELEVEIPAGGEKRVDWTVKVVAEGEAAIRMTALTDEESDAIEMTFPVLVHGIDKMISRAGRIDPNGPGAASVSLVVPAERRPETTRLEIRYSPSLAGAILDAVPYLLNYPYGCTEQTLSRFVPAAQVRKALQRMGMTLSDLAKAGRPNLNPQELGDPVKRRNRWGRTWWTKEAVYSDKVMNDIIDRSLERLYDFQHGDGGWGWWKNTSSSRYNTAHVLYGLRLAVESDVKVRPDVIARGLRYLASTIDTDEKRWKEHPWLANDHVLAAYVLARCGQANQKLNRMLMERRRRLSLQGKCLLSLALRRSGDREDADLVLANVRQFAEEDRENGTMWVRTPQAYWWWWYNNDIETATWYLKAMMAADPRDPAAPKLVKWLLNNRKGGYYWRSTRDTAHCVAAFVDFMKATKEDRPDYTLTVLLDGKPLRKARVTGKNMFTMDNAITLSGAALPTGKHTLSFVREGKGAVYFNAYLSYFSKEEDIRRAGLEIKVERSYYKLERVAHTEKVVGSRGQDVGEKRVRYRKVELKSGDTLTSGDLVQVELTITSKNDYDYLVFEDYKPAGCEAVELRSGARWGDLISHMELRDTRVVFFVGWLRQGTHKVKYRLRAEIPGKFHGLPTKAWAMYAPELKANADEIRVQIVDRKD